MERKLIAAAVSSALVVPMSAQAVEFAVSGHVNRAVIVVDQDGNDKDGDLQHVDANSSGSRVRFVGSEDLDNGMTVGARVELGIDGSGTNRRHADLSLNTAGGKLTLGHTSVATDGMAHGSEAFNGGSWLAGVTNWCSYAGSGPACPTNDGDRRDTLRYDTPALGPASVAVSAGNDEYWDAKLTIAGSMGDAGYNFRIGHIGKYEVTEEEKVEHKVTDGVLSHDITPSRVMEKGKITTISGAVSFGQGTSLGAAWSQDDKPNDPTKDHEYTYVSLDHDYGDGSVGAYWKQGEESDGGSSKEGTLWGVGFGHNIGGGATAYAGFRHIEADGAKDMNVYLAGMRVTFN